MKSFFTNLGKVLLCGAAIAMIGCTDLHSDIQEAVTEKTENYDQEIADLQSALDALEAELKADYALKSELEAVEAELADEKAALQAAIAELDALEAELADEKAAVQAAIADLNAAIEAGDKAAIEAAQAAVDAAKAELNAVIEAGDKAAIEAAQAAVDAAKADLNAAIDEVKAELAGMGTDVEGLKSRLDALEAACQCEEIAAQLAALDAYVLSLEEAVVGRLDTVEQALSAVTVLLEDEAAARNLADEELWTSIYGLQEVLSAVNNKIDDLEAQEYVSAAELEAVYTSIYEAQASISSVYNQLLDLAAKHDQDVEEIYAKINVVEEGLSALIFTVSDVQDELAAQLAAFEAYKLSVEEAIALATEDMQEYLTQMLNLTNDQIAEIVSLQEALVGRIDTIEKTITNLINLNNDQYEEVLSLIIETKEELTLVVNNILNYIADMQGQIDDLAARVQSLVFIPEYSDGKATIEWGLLIDNDSAVNFLLNRIVTTSNISAFKSLVKEYIAKVKNVIVNQAGDLEATVDEFLANLVDEDAIESALAELLTSIEDLVAAEIYNLLKDAEINFDINLDVDLGEHGTYPGTGEANGSIELPEVDTEVQAEEIAAKIMADIVAAFQIDGGFDLTDTVKGLLSSMKKVGVSTARELVSVLRNTSINDVFNALDNDEFKALLSKMFSAAKSLQAKILENTAVLKKESVIRYKVQAQNPTAAAAAIAANWKEVLSYDVETVDVRAAAPGLKITKVVAKGDEIHVSVLPQNFHSRFYLTYILEDSFLYGAAESFFDKFGKTGLISYSAALVLNDGNNIRSTEYVNFVSSENPEIYTPEVVNHANQVVETNYVVLPENIDSYEFCSDLHMAYLSVPYREAYTKSQLEKKGYSGIVEKKAVKYNQTTGIAGPCRFNGLVGTFYDYFSYPFETVWSVNDITLVVRYDVSFE